MELYTKYKMSFWLILLGLAMNHYSKAQCVVPEITAIGNSGPVCPGGMVTLSASGSVGGVSSSFVRMAGIGANLGNREFDELFSSGDRPGTITRISENAFNSMAAAGPAALRANYDVLLFTWATSSLLHAPWSLIEGYLALGGSVFWEDNINITDLAPGIIGNSNDGGYGCGYTLVSPAPFPALVANGVNGCFANHHLSVSSWPSWMKVYIKGGAGENMAIAGIHPTGRGRLIVQGPDQDYHAFRGAAGTGGNQYKFMLNQMDFLIAEQTGISWTGPNGYTSKEANPIITNFTAANAGIYTATLTNTTGGGCTTSATTTVVLLEASTASITASGTTNLCPGGSVTLTANEGIAYLWNTGATSRSITTGSAGNYTVKVTNINSCSAISPPVAVQVNSSYCNAVPVSVAKPLNLSADNDCEANVLAIDFDGGSTDADGDDLTFSISPTGPYAIGITNVVLTVTDTKGASSTSSTTVTVVDDTKPTLTAPAAIVRITDPGECVATITNLGIPIFGDNCSGATVLNNAPAIFPKGPTTVTWTVTDAAGNTATATQLVTVEDKEDPVIVAQANITKPNDTGTCGAIVTFATPGATDNCAGVVVTKTDGTGLSSGSIFPVGTTYLQYTATDGAGNTAVSNFSITITNTDPVLNPITAPIAPVQINTSISANANFADNNLANANWTWGDGQTSAGTIASSSVSGSHAYASPGVYTVSLLVTDACGKTATSDFQYVVIYDANGGFVTGGGWINSPAGAYIAHPTAVGKANFGFVSKYHKGATTPSGNTEFEFKTGNLNFKSTSYEWLVVAGTKAQFKGEGKINGSGIYGFLLSAVDGQVNGAGGTDKFRIKIWEKASNELVYDNNIGSTDDAPAATALGGGSVVIHEGGKSSRMAYQADWPAETAGLKAFPNPFSKKITMEFSFKQDENYSLAVYDIKGSLVKILQTGKAKAGTVIRAAWESGKSAQGIFVVRLATQHGVQHMRLVKE